METKKILDTVFEGHNLTTAIWGGRIVWIASEVSMALGYSKPGKISTLVSTKWADDFVEDEDFQVLKGDRFQKFAGFDDLSWGASKRLSSKARRTMLLTESGLNLVLINTRKPVGVRLRRHISSVVLPQMRRGMVKECPIAELEARYRQEISDLKDRIIMRDELIIERDNLLLEQGRMLNKANYRLGIMDGAVGHVRKSASAAGASLAAHKKTKKFRDMN